MDQFDFNVNDIFECKSAEVLIPEQVTEKIVELEARIRELQTAERELKTKLINEMRRKGLLRVDNEDVVISYQPPGKIEEFDIGRLKAEQPDIYFAYLRFSPRTASVSIKVK